jgi:hypothetical protein
VIGIVVFIAILVGALAGFVFAMQHSKKFNKIVRESSFFAPIAKSKNPHIRSSLALDQMVALNELTELMDREERMRYGK